MKNKPVIIYFSYDGMLEPLGQSQVIAYQERLARSFDVHVVSFEKHDDWSDAEARAGVQERLAAAGIYWHPLRYHKKPSALATAWDVASGIAAGLLIARRHDAKILHARSYVAAVMCLVLKRLTGARFVFDMRGFWADERVDGGLWRRESALYRVAKWFERKFLLNADMVVSLTHAGVREIQRFPYLVGRMPPMTVIPTCADLSIFVPNQGARDTASFTLGYVGSAGTWYMFDEVLACFAQLRQLRPDARLLIVNRGEHAFIARKIAGSGIPAGSVELSTARHSEVPLLMGRMDAAIFFIRPVYSKQASAPTKLAEFLGCGIPCLANAGVGDMAEILESGSVGVAVDSFDQDTLLEGARQLMLLASDPDIARRCAAVAATHFSIEEGVQRYQRAYAQLLP